jgi:mannose-6-phosphate isomerase-like protein (cupin superfamily)
MARVRLSDVPEIAIDAGRWQPLNQRLGVSAFGVNGVVMDPGEQADIEHDEAGSGHQEVYVVVSGRAWFRVGDEEFEAVPGDVVAVGDPAVTRDYKGLEPGTRLVCFGAAAGDPHPYGDWITAEAAER